MAIKSNVGSGVINILTTDTVIRQQQASIDRYHVSSLNIFNDTAASITVDIYVSSDLTSASGDKVSEETIGINSESDINAVIGQGYSSLNIIAVASAVGLNASITSTEYSAGD